MVILRSGSREGPLVIVLDYTDVPTDEAPRSPRRGPLVVRDDADEPTAPRGQEQAPHQIRQYRQYRQSRRLVTPAGAGNSPGYDHKRMSGGGEGAAHPPSQAHHSEKAKMRGLQVPWL